MSTNEGLSTLATPARKTASKSKTRSTATLAAKTDPVEVLRKQVLAALDELKAKDVKEIDVRGKTSIADILGDLAATDDGGIAARGCAFLELNERRTATR